MSWWWPTPDDDNKHTVGRPVHLSQSHLNSMLSVVGIGWYQFGRDQNKLTFLDCKLTRWNTCLYVCLCTHFCLGQIEYTNAKEQLTLFHLYRNEPSWFMNDLIWDTILSQLVKLCACSLVCVFVTGEIVLFTHLYGNFCFWVGVRSVE